MLTGTFMSRLDVMSTSIQQVQSLLAAHLAESGSTTQVLGRSFLYDALGGKPHKSQLDAISRDVPIFIDSIDLHSCWLNSAALRAAGIDKTSVPPLGGSYEKDDEGELTGMVHETAVMEVLWPYLARQLDLESRLKYLDQVFDAYLESGITGAVDMALTYEDLAALQQAYQIHGNRLPIRVSAHIIIYPSGTGEDRLDAVRKVKAAQDRLRAQGIKGEWLKINGIKIMIDGVVDSCTAYLLEPYVDSSRPGPIWPAEKLQPVVNLADELDLQVALHAIGDAASQLALDVLEVAIRTNKTPTRHRLEHLELITPESIDRLTALGIVASVQPSHADPIGLVNWMNVLGRHTSRCSRAFPLSEFKEKGSNMAFGSDSPVLPHHPFPNMYSATTRKSFLDPDPHHPVTQDLAITGLEKMSIGIEDAVRCYTLGSAFSIRQEDRLGSLEPGKLADFVVVDIDPFQQNLTCLRDAQRAVRDTWMSGVKVWRRDVSQD